MPLFDLELPIIQAPMAGSCDSRLAIAVSNAGGLGSLPAALLTLDALRDELRKLAAATSKPYSVNFFCHVTPQPNPERAARWRDLLLPYYRELELDPDAIPAGPARTPFDDNAADLLEEIRPPIVSFHFGLPSPDLLERVRATGAKVLSTATTVDEARWLATQKVDAIIAQGAEAGGHRGMFLSEDVTTQLGTFALVPQIAAATNIPVIAAGGIADARGVAAALALGASAAQIGTAYLLCPEATTSPLHRAALQRPQHTAITNILTGRPARGIINRVMREIGPLHPGAPAFPTAATAIAPLRAAAEKAGRDDFTSMWAGQNTSGCRDQPAAQLTRSLAPG